MLDLEAIKARAEKASPGPWHVFQKTQVLDGDAGSDMSEYIVPINDMRPEVMRPENAQFIAHARTDIPALIARVEELEKECETCQGQGKVHDGSCSDIECCGAGDGWDECQACAGSGLEIVAIQKGYR